MQIFAFMLLASVGMFVGLSFPEVSSAFTISIKIGTEDLVQSTDADGDGTHSVCLAEGNHAGGIIIGRKLINLGCPKVIVTSDTLGDNLKITNLKISKQSGNPTVQNFRIAVWADLVKEPHSAPNIGYWWDHSNGSLSGAGSTLQIAGWYQHPVGDPLNDPWTCTGTWNSTTYLCGKVKSPGSWALEHDDYQPSTGLSMSENTRHLQLEQTFTLVGATASFTTSSFLIQHTNVGECEEDDARETCKKNKRAGAKGTKGGKKPQH